MRIQAGLLIFFLTAAEAFGQGRISSSVVTDTFRVRPENRYFLSAIAVIAGSEEIYIRRRLLPKSGYRFEYAPGYFEVADSVPYSVFDTIIVRYRTLLTGLQKEYRLQELRYLPSANKNDSMLSARVLGQPLTNESIFGRGIERSGSLTRGFTVGSTKDLTLQSGLRLQLNGNLTDDIEIIAALTDENSPIQPEGNTERLDELDKVFIQLKHTNASATFGDFELKKQNGEFGTLTRKLQGLAAEAHFRNTEGFFAFAASRGKFSSNTFNGNDAVQGPYQMLGSDGEKDIIVIAGSERVFLDGSQLRRGEQNDYTIDYGNAQLTFTTRKLITSASRIIIEFEYTDRRYSRAFFSVGAGSAFLGDRLRVTAQYIREADDQNSPIDLTLSDAEKEIVRNAGDDRNKAVTDGVVPAAADSNGVRRGTYEPVDSLIGNTPVTFYRYNPGSLASIYNVTFSYAGENRGNYIRTGPGKFTFAGINGGNYNPVRFLPLPEKKEALTLSSFYSFGRYLRFKLDGAVSSYDKNRFSSVEDNDNAGGAVSMIVSSLPVLIDFRGTLLGTVEGSWKERFVQSRYTSLERFGEVEFNRLYNVQNAGSSVNEHLRELMAKYSPMEGLTFGAMYGGLQRDQSFRSTRMKGNVTVSKLYGLDGNYEAEYVKGDIVPFASKWLRQTGIMKYSVGNIRPSLKFRQEEKVEKILSDSLLGSSIRYMEIEPGIEFNPVSWSQFNFDYFHRIDESARFGQLRHEALSRGFGLGVTTSRKSLTSSLQVSLRDKKFSDEFLLSGMTNSQIVLIKSQVRFTPAPQLTADIFYDAATQKTSLLDRVFIEVRKGLGSYRYLGDLNANGVKDENEFEPAIYDGDYILTTVPSDKLYPVIDLKTSARFRYHFKDVFPSSRLALLILDPLTFETYARIEENSTEPDIMNIYLLKQPYLRNPVTTIRGNNLFQQTLQIFENNTDFSVRFYYSQSRSLNKFGTGMENGYRREQSVLLKYQLVREIGGTAEVISNTDNVYQKSNPLRNRNIEGTAVKFGFSYRPVPFVESGVKIQAGRNTDRFPATPTVVDDNSQLLYVQLSFAGAGRLRAEAERVELSANFQQNYLPFELTSGNGIGKNFFIRINFDYRITSHLQFTANYDSRSLAGSKLIHTFRGEARAFF